MARYEPLRQRSFIVGSFGKTYHATGWKVGYAVAPAALTAEFRKVHQFVTFSTNTPMQYALAEFVAERARIPGAAGVLSAQARPVPVAASPDRASARCRRAAPTSSCWTTRRSPTRATWTFALRLTKEHGVASIPTSAFLYTQAAAEGAALLFREEGRDAGARGGARLRGVVSRRAIVRRSSAALALAFRSSC